MDPSGPAIFTIGRMNPPTSGHLELIKAMMVVALKQGVDKVYIILSHTKNSTKDPLGCDRKRAILVTEGMIESLKQANPSLSEIEVDIRCMDDLAPYDCGKHPILKQVCNILIDAGSPTHMILIVGEDRASSYDWIGKYLDNKVPPVVLDIEPLPRPEGAMSATYMRKLVLEGKEEEFIDTMVANGLSDENAASLYAELKRELKGSKRSGKEIEEEPPPKRRKTGKTKGGKKKKNKKTRRRKRTKRTKRKTRTHKKRKTRTHKKQKR